MELADLLPKSVQRAMGVDEESKAARALEQRLGIGDLGLQARFEVIRSAVEDNTIQEKDARGWINYRIKDDAADKKREISRAARPWGLRTQTSMQAYVPDPNETVGPTMHGDDDGFIDVSYQSVDTGVTSPDDSNPSLNQRADVQESYSNGHAPEKSPFSQPEFPAIQGDEKAADPRLILSNFLEQKILVKYDSVVNQSATFGERADQIYCRFLDERGDDPQKAFLKAQRELSLLERAVEEMSGSGEIAANFEGRYQFQNKKKIIDLTLRQLAADGDRKISYDAAVNRLERIGLTREVAYTILPPRDETEEEQDVLNLLEDGEEPGPVEEWEDTGEDGEPLNLDSYLAENFDIIEKGGNARDEAQYLLGLSLGDEIESVGLNYSGGEWGSSDDPATGEFEIPNGEGGSVRADDGRFYTGDEEPVSVGDDPDGIATEQNLPARKPVDPNLMSKLRAALEEELPKEENRKPQRRHYANNSVASTSHYFAQALRDVLEGNESPEAIPLSDEGGALLPDEETNPFVESVLFSSEKDPRYVAIAAYREESAQQRSRLGRRQEPSEFIAGLDVMVEDVGYEASGDVLLGFQPEITDEELAAAGSDPLADYWGSASTSDILDVEDSHSDDDTGRESSEHEAAQSYNLRDPENTELVAEPESEQIPDTQRVPEPANDPPLERRATTQRARRSDFPFKRAAAGLALLGALAAAYHTGGPPESRVGDVSLLTELSHEEAPTPEPRATPSPVVETQTPDEYREAPVAEAQSNPEITIQGDNTIITVSLPEEFRRESFSVYDTLATALATSPGVTDSSEDGVWADAMQATYEGKDLAQVVGRHSLADNAGLMVSVIDATAAYNGCDQEGLAARGCLLTKLNNGEEVRAVVPSQYVQLETQDASGSSEISETQDGVASSYVHNANGEDFVVAAAYQGNEADDVVLEEEIELHGEGQELFAEDFEGQATQVASIDELGLYNTGDQVDPNYSEVDDASYLSNNVLTDLLDTAYYA